MKNAILLLLLAFAGPGCRLDAPTLKVRPGIVSVVLGDRSGSFNGHTLLDTVVLARIARLLVASGRPAALYFETAGDVSFTDPLELLLPGLPPFPSDPTVFEQEDSVLESAAYRVRCAAEIKRFLSDCQRRLDATENQAWTDLKGGSLRLMDVLAFPQYHEWQKLVFENTDGLHHLPKQAPEKYCADWPAGVQVFTAGRAPENRCDAAHELGSARQFPTSLSYQLSKH